MNGPLIWLHTVTTVHVGLCESWDGLDQALEFKYHDEDDRYTLTSTTDIACDESFGSFRERRSAVGISVGKPEFRCSSLISHLNETQSRAYVDATGPHEVGPQVQQPPLRIFGTQRVSDFQPI